MLSQNIGQVLGQHAAPVHVKSGHAVDQLLGLRLGGVVGGGGGGFEEATSKSYLMALKPTT